MGMYSLIADQEERELAAFVAEHPDMSEHDCALALIDARDAVRPNWHSIPHGELRTSEIAEMSTQEYRWYLTWSAQERQRAAQIADPTQDAAAEDYYAKMIEAARTEAGPVPA